MPSRARLYALALPALVGCGSDTIEESPLTECPPGEVLVDGQCQPPSPEACPPGYWVTPADTCEPAGMSASLCADGFTGALTTTCGASLPPDPCPAGTIALVGDATCAPVMDCGEGPWGTLPVDGNTIHVDASYAGVSDGTADAPFTTIAAALQAATPGSLVAVAAGTYVEDVEIAQQPIQLWGRCPELVEVTGTGNALATVLVLPGSDGTVVGGLAVTGPGLGVGVTGSAVTLDRLWVHDTGASGVDAVDDLGAATLSIQRSLIEAATGIGLRALRSSLELTGAVVRGTRANADGLSGRGLSLHGATASLTGLVVDDNRDVGLRLAGTTASIHGSVVRDTNPSSGAEELAGRGIVMASIGGTVEASDVTMRNVSVYGNHDVGVLVYGSQLAAENLYVADTTWESGTITGGYGINVQVDDTQGVPSTVTIRGGAVVRSHEAGIRVASSEVTVEGVLVDDTRSRPSDGRFGYGIVVEAEPVTQLPATATLIGDHVVGSREVGVLVFEAGATIDKLLVTDTLANTDGLGGDGIVVLSQPTPSSATIFRSRLQNNARAGIGNFGGTVTLGDDELICHAFALAGEPMAGLDFVFYDQGNNRCGCPTADGDCKAVSAGLAPPTPLE